MDSLITDKSIENGAKGEQISTHVEVAPVQPAGDTAATPSKQERRLVQKQYMVMVPFLCLGYFFGYLVSGTLPATSDFSF